MTDTVIDTTKATRKVTVAIIGAGTAGHNAYRQVYKVTDSLVIINEGIWSTTCTTMGCMPSKALIAAAERAHHATDSANFGVESQVTINGPQVMARVRHERDHFASYPLKNVAEWPDETKVYGRAVINESGLIETHTANGEVEIIEADYTIIATGSNPHVPSGWKEALGELLITSDTLFELPDLPKSLAVVGTGAIGLELAQSMQRLGVDVAVFNRSKRVGGIKDDAVNDKAIACLSDELDLRLDTQITQVKRQPNDQKDLAVIEYTDADGQQQTWQGEMVLVATGRRNTLDKLGVENVGVELDDQNRPQNMDYSNGKIEGKNIYIVGDANAYRPLLHVTSNEGYRAGKEVALLLTGLSPETNLDAAIINDPDCAADTTILNDITAEKAYYPAPLMSIIFSDPQIMAVGHTLKSIEDDGIAYVIGEVSFDNQGRSHIMGVNCGLLRIYVAKDSGEVLGACMIGPDAEYIAHILATAMTNKLTVNQLLDSPFYHPTILEGLRTALRDARGHLIK